MGAHDRHIRGMVREAIAVVVIIMVIAAIAGYGVSLLLKATAECAA
jgi:hypothetical protein